MTVRLADLVDLLSAQWPLALWSAAPIGLWAIARPYRAVAAFCGSTALVWLLFLYVYRIPDPGGMTASLACCVAPAIGVFASLIRPAVVGACAVVSLLVPTAVTRWQANQVAAGYDVMEAIRGRARVGLDLPDAIQRVPEQAYLTLPCGHYGCIQVVNYYRFVDPMARRKEIQIGTLQDPHRWPWRSMPGRIPLDKAMERRICTFHWNEVLFLRKHGFDMVRLDRPPLAINGRVVPRIPLYCSSA